MIKSNIITMLIMLGIALPQGAMATASLTQTPSGSVDTNAQVDRLFEDAPKPLSAQTSNSKQVVAPIVLQGGLEVDVIPRVEDFEQAIKKDAEIP
jgi:hypothetical protein